MNLRRWLAPVIIFFLPFAYNFTLVIPIGNYYQRIGNDFEILYYNYKVYLLASLNQGHLPLWSPAEAAGFPFYSNPFVGLLYPFNLLLSAFYNAFGGYTALDHQRFTVLGLAIFGLGLYYWLRNLNLSPRAVLFVSLIMPLSFKLAEILRFPNAVHAAAWYPWILLGMTGIFKAPTWRGTWGHGAILAFSLFCLITAGYPYYIYYGLFLFPPYLALLLLPQLRQHFFPSLTIHLRRSISVLILSGSFAILASAPMLVETVQLLNNTTDRSGGDYEYSTWHKFDLQDTVGSLIFPPSSITEGWFYFGIFGVLILLLYFFTPSSAWYGSRWVKAGFIVWTGTIIWLVFGSQSLLFRVLYDLLPGFSNLRVWPRLNITLVPILAWLLAIAYTHLEYLLTHRSRQTIIFLVIAYGFILLAQSYLYVNQIFDDYWWNYHKQWMFEVSFLLFGLLSFVALLIFFIIPRPGRSKWGVVAAFVLIAALDLKGGRPTAWIWAEDFIPVPERTHIDVAGNNLASFDVLRTDAYNTLSLTDEFSVGIVLNWYFQRYVDFLSATDSETAARQQLLGVTQPVKLFFTPQLHYGSVQSFLSDTIEFSFEIIGYDGDQLMVDVDVPQTGYLSFIDNWDPDWNVRVDGDSSDIELLFDSFKSVRLSEGKHRVVFTYSPRILGISLRRE